MNTYFVLPHDFWRAEIFAKLTLPGLAMLLVIAKETNQKSEMYMPYGQAPAWYRISPKTAQNGIKDLTRHGLVYVREERIKAPLSSTGYTTRVWYSLTGAYGTETRKALRAKASKARKRRATTPAPARKRLKRATGGGTGGQKTQETGAETTSDRR
ncbi:hypothetical protein [Georgenia muralis]